MSENQYEVIAQSYPTNLQKRTNQQRVNGFSVEHPLQGTVYAYRKGIMKVLVPLEINVVPMGNGVLEPELPAPNGYPISGQIQPHQSQQNANRLPSYTGNAYRQYQFGPSYSAPASNQPYPPAITSYNGYSQQPSYRYPYYAQPNQRGDLSETKPWPQFKPIQQAQQVGK